MSSVLVMLSFLISLNDCWSFFFPPDFAFIFWKVSLYNTPCFSWTACLVEDRVSSATVILLCLQSKHFWSGRKNTPIRRCASTCCQLSTVLSLLSPFPHSLHLRKVGLSFAFWNKTQKSIAMRKFWLIWPH